MEKTNDRLLVRALSDGFHPAPGCDFTRGVMARIAQDAAAAKRRETRLLLAGASIGGASLAAVGVWAVVRFTDAGLFHALRDAFAWSDTVPLGLWCYTAGVFLLLAAAGTLWRRRMPVVAGK